MLVQNYEIAPKSDRFTHPDAYWIFQSVLGTPSGHSITIDLSGASDATTSAFARLVLLRRELLRRGCDLRLVGLRDRVQKLYDVNRLADVLPSN
jgi:ABC-type transporter Mla MlaB component